MKVLLTGGAGYIGSHTAQVFLDAGHEVVVFDDLSTGFVEAIPEKADFIHGDVRHFESLSQAIASSKINAIVHFAAKLNVKESVSGPLAYYETNVLGIINVLRAMKEHGLKNIVFSSTAALFGDQIQDRAIREDDPTDPLNPYGTSKYMCEQILKDTSEAHGIQFCALRYFNVAGAADDGCNGQRTANAYHLIHIGSQAAAGKRSRMDIFGTDYLTPDGTCIRDYIHVQDLADIHLLAMNYLEKGGASIQLNCGYGRGFSVREVINKIKEISGANFEVFESARRSGDAKSLVADSEKLKRVLGWKPQRDNLDLICRSAIDWERRVSTL